MVQALQFTTTVLPGGQIQLPPGTVSAGETVEVIVTPQQQLIARPTGDILEFLDSLPPGPRAAKTWEEVEEQFQEERNSWDH